MVVMRPQARSATSPLGAQPSLAVSQSVPLSQAASMIRSSPVSTRLAVPRCRAPGGTVRRSIGIEATETDDAGGTPTTEKTLTAIAAGNLAEARYAVLVGPRA